MDNIGTLSIQFIADDSGVQTAIDNIVKTINQMEENINSAMKNASKSINDSANRIVKSTNKISNSMSSLGEKTKSSSKSIGSSILSIGKTLVAVKIFQWITKFSEKMFMLSSDMAEVENLFQVSFGNMSKDAEEFANSLQKAWGVDTTPIKEQTAYLNQMFKSMNFGKQTAYDMATSLEQLSYDMSSLYNIDQETMYKKLQSGMAGQIRPLKSLGVLIDDTTIKQYAMNKGIWNGVGVMNQQQKALARYYAILDQTKSSVGDFSRTIEQPQNQLRILQSRLNSIARYWGLAFLPIAQFVIPYLNALARVLIDVGQSLASFMARLFGVGKSWKDIVGSGFGKGADFSGLEDADDSASGLSSGLSSAEKNAKKLKKQLMGIDEINNLTTSDDTSGGASGGVGGFTQGLEWEVPKLEIPNEYFEPLYEKAKNTLSKIFKPLKDSFDKYMPDIVSNYKESFSNLGHIGSGVIDVLSKNWEKWFGSLTDLFFSLQKTASMVFKGITIVLREVWDNGGKHLFESIGNLATAFVNLAKKINEKFVQPIISWFNDNIAPILGRVIGFIIDQIANMIDSFTNVVNYITENEWVFDTLVGSITAIGTAFGGMKLVEFGQSLTENVANKLLNVSDRLSDIKNIGNPFTKIKDGIKDIRDNLVLVKEGFKDVITKVKDLSKQKMTDIIDNVKNYAGAIKEAYNRVKEWLVIHGLAIKDWIAEKVQIIATTTATWLQNTATQILTATQTAFNFVMSMNPMVLFALAIVGVITALALLGVKLEDVINFAKKSFGQLGESIKNTCNSIIGGIEWLINKIISGVNWFIKQLNKFKFKIPDWVPKIGGKDFSINIKELGEVKLPRLASGGLAYGDTAVEVGEYMNAKNNPEVIAPLSDLNGIMENAITKIIQEQQVQTLPTQQDRIVNATINISGKTIYQAMVEEDKKSIRSTGRSALARG